MCSRKGLIGEQGVILLAGVVGNLMLQKDAVDVGMFPTHPVRPMDQALGLLTGLPVGRWLTSGRFAPGSLCRRVDDRLAEMAELVELAENTARRRKKERPHQPSRSHERPCPYGSAGVSCSRFLLGAVRASIATATTAGRLLLAGHGK